MYVCLWSPGWSIGGESGAEGGAGVGAAVGAAAGVERGDDGAEAGPWGVAASLAERAPRLRVEREVVWADGRGLDATSLAERLVACLEAAGVTARAGVAGVPVAAELAARWGVAWDDEEATPFLVKERTGWGWRRTFRPSSTGSPAVSGPPGARSAAGSEVRSEGSSEGRSGAGSGAGSGDAAARPGPGGGEDPGREADRVATVPGWTPEEARAWMAPLPVTALEPEDRVRTLLEGVGIGTVGELAALSREAVEVRFGAGAVELWRRARADDRRVLFEPVPPERPHGSIDFVDYVLTDPSRLLFTANALLGPICDRLADRGEHARTLRLTLPLANGTVWERTIRPARPTGSRETWLRLIRGLLERLTVPDAVAGLRLEAGSTEAAGVRQGDLFDRGFATAAVVEAAVARLAEQEVRAVAAETGGHPLMERRSAWREVGLEAGRAGGRAGDGARGRVGERVEGRAGGRAGSQGRERADGSPAGESPGLGLQLLPEPRPVVVETAVRRDHEIPVRLRDRRGWREVTLAAGPDRISGGQWEERAYAREYYRCVTDEGVLLWVYRDAVDGRWFLHGYWD